MKGLLKNQRPSWGIAGPTVSARDDGSSAIFGHTAENGRLRFREIPAFTHCFSPARSLFILRRFRFFAGLLTGFGL